MTSTKELWGSVQGQLGEATLNIVYTVTYYIHVNENNSKLLIACEM